jgi:uncharacterized protein (TIGR02453 family)
MTEPLFTAKTLTFLRALKRHNDREWFRARREEYEACVRGPLLALVERMGPELALFAPELVASPKQSLYRVYRDTRFSADKSPLKTHAAAIFPCRGLPRHEGAGLYFELSPNHALMAGGIYAPQAPELHAIREHLAANFRRFKSIVESAGFRSAFGEVGGDRLQRVPRGFTADHPAAEFLKFRQFLVAREYPATFACDRRFYAELLARFRQMAPLVHFLNEPLLSRAGRSISPAGRSDSAGCR